VDQDKFEMSRVRRKVFPLSIIILPAWFLVTILSLAQDEFGPVENNDDWTPVISVFEGVEMVLVPTGCFEMGSDDGGVNERPPHEICFEAPFWIDRTEVSNSEYGSTGEFDDLELPRENVSWRDALEHCESRNARLPTEAEWEYAASGPSNFIYTWGDDLEFNLVVWRENSPNRPQPVGSIPDGASWVGSLNMLGNVREWTNSLFENYPYDRDDGRESDEVEGIRTIRGGAYNLSRIVTTSDRTDDFEATEEIDNIGFRCVRAFDGTLPVTDTEDNTEVVATEIPASNTPLVAAISTQPATSTAPPQATASDTAQPRATTIVTEARSTQTSTLPATSTSVATPAPTATPTGTPTSLTIVNESSDIWICYVFFERNSAIQSIIERDRLGPRERIDDGQERFWELEPGVYNIGIYDCDLEELLSRDDVRIVESVTLFFPSGDIEP
jgi:hypothetical protein